MKYIVVDIDAGTDDYIALWYLLNVEKKGEVKILGVICTHGNTSLEHVVNNVVRLLEITGRTDIPVYKGTNTPLILHKSKIPYFHGKDGFGDLKYDTSPDLSIVSNTPAALAINDIIRANPNEVSIVCLGPLTTLALTIKLYHQLNDQIRDVWIMGGNYTGVGNTSSSAEFNFHLDPEAAYIVLENLKCPIYIFPWETCLIPHIPLDWRFDMLGEIPELKYVTLAEKKVYKTENYKRWVPCDLFAAFCFINPEKNITKCSNHHASIELRGELTRGQVVLDHLKENVPNVNIIEDFDVELLKEELLNLIK